MDLSFILKLVIGYLYLLYCMYEKTVNANYIWQATLEKETKIHQQLLLYENDFNNGIIYELKKSISKMIPTRIADFKTIMNEDKSMELSPYLLEVTRIVIIPIRNNNNLSNLLKIFESIANMSQQKTRPKVLIATKVEKSIKYKKFFQKCWVKQFLDITILELKQRKDDKAVLAENSNAVDANLHYYNPFTKRSAKMTFTNQSILFPYKLHNLNGYKMSMPLFHLAPYLNITRNSTGHVLNVQGPDMNLWITLSKVLNFSLKIIFSNSTGFVKINCTKDYNPDLVKKTIYNELQFIGIQSTLLKSCLNNFLTIGKGTRAFRMVIVVPIFPSDGKIYTTEWNIFNVLFIFCLILIPWLISKFLKFDHRNWKLMYIFQIALGLTAPQMPVKKLERTVFLSIMFFFLLQSSYIYSTLSNFQLQKEILHEINTFEELYSKNLTLITHGGRDKFESNDTAYEKLINNAIHSGGRSFDECAQAVNDYQNVSCYGRELVAYLSMQKIKNPDGKVRMKIFNQVLVVPGSSIYFAGGSPYPSRFNLVTSALVESGISDKWDAEYFPKISYHKSQVDLFKQKMSVTSKILKLIIMLLVFGYTCSYFAFVGEILIHNYLNL